jgi:chaperonin GroEL (HSP60 family)
MQSSKKTCILQNASAIAKLAQMVSTCLGPNAMSKMMIGKLYINQFTHAHTQYTHHSFVDSFAGIVITNDGWRVLQECQLMHPASKLIVDMTNHQHSSIGDGSTSTLLLCDALLQNCIYLLYLFSNENTLHESVVCDSLQQLVYLIRSELILKLKIEVTSEEHYFSLLRSMVVQILETKHASAKFKIELTDLIMDIIKHEKAVRGTAFRIVKIPQSEVSQSRVLPQTTVVQVQSLSKILSRKKTLSDVNICMCSCTFQMNETSNIVNTNKRHISDPSTFLRIEQNQTVWWNNLIAKIVEHDVHLLIVTHSVCIIGIIIVYLQFIEYSN